MKTAPLEHMSEKVNITSFPPELPVGATEPVFSVGNPDLTKDVVTYGIRRLYWREAPDDMQLSSIAGWSDWKAFDAAGQPCLLMPIAARSASSVLSGMEAFENEKTEVATFISNYIKNVNIDTGAIDVSLALDHVVISRGHTEMFVTPPHVLSRDTSIVQNWAQVLLKDAEEVLQSEPRKSELLTTLRKSIASIVIHKAL